MWNQGRRWNISRRLARLKDGGIEAQERKVNDILESIRRRMPMLDISNVKSLLRMMGYDTKYSTLDQKNKVVLVLYVQDMTSIGIGSLWLRSVDRVRSWSILCATKVKTTARP